MEGHPGRQPGAEALTRRPGERDLDRPLRQTAGTVTAGDFPRQDATDGAVDIAHRDRPLADLLPVLERRGADLHQLPVERVVEHRDLGPCARARHLRRQVGHAEDHRQVYAARLPVVDGVVDLEQVGAADHVGEAPHPERGHDAPDLLGHEHHVGDDVLGGAAEARAQLGILGGDPDRAGVEVADPHHDAAHRDQRRGREAELVGAEQRPDDDVAAGLDLPVDLDGDPGAQVVEQQRLLGLGQTYLPGDAGRLDRGLRRGPGAAVVAGDRDVVGVGLGDPRGDGADPDLRDQLDRYRAVRVGAAQVVDQLLEVLDRVDVVVRGRADEAHPGVEFRIFAM